MSAGYYDEARFIYTTPSSPNDAVEEAGRALTVYDNKRGPELDQDFISGPRKLNTRCLIRMDVARCGEVSPGFVEYHMVFTVLHAITDGTSAHASLILELLGGSTTANGPAQTDLELLRVLEMEWTKRWADLRSHYTLGRGSTSASASQAPGGYMEDRLQRRAIGAHVFPRLFSPVSKQALLDVKFDRIQTAALLANPEIRAPNTLPIMMYTGISLRHHLAPISPLASSMSLALGCGNIVLPAFIPSAADPRAIFWLRSPSSRAILSAERIRRVRAFARQDDAANETFPPSPQPPQQSPINAAVPSVALLGISHLGDLAALYRTERYPAIEFVDSVGHSRKAKGGILLFTRSAQSLLRWYSNGTRSLSHLGWLRNSWDTSSVGCMSLFSGSLVRSLSPNFNHPPLYIWNQ
ncbi:hypothetical protein B0H17DRAFT_1212261 [Mycena rosella]|uniref:Uncharacterized protein n=1 Tax=Mycena rosella TaxID=1033263 RepID=A0AAD7G5F0_MYCRO|nr:hypothetical protein B0H17DRAFT_1212261 [Mycena rosella]